MPYTWINTYETVDSLVAKCKADPTTVCWHYLSDIARLEVEIEILERRVKELEGKE